MEYIQVTIPCLDEKKEIISAELENIGYEGFWEDGSLINAFIDKELFNEKLLYDSLAKYKMENSYTSAPLENKNWNEEWENNFEPVIIDDTVLIKASFHNLEKSYKHSITINPEMSFGTGHHETTELMIRLMLDLDFSEKSVLDMGTGTGVLAILAEQLGAKQIEAIEIDYGSYLNCVDNVVKNGCNNIEIKEGGIEVVKSIDYDIILSNITKNINQSLLPELAKKCNAGSSLIISGFLDFDKEEMKNFCTNLGYSHIKSLEVNKWQGMAFQKA